MDRQAGKRSRSKMQDEEGASAAAGEKQNAKKPPKTAAKKAAPQKAVALPLPVPDETVWKETVLTRLSRCASAEGLQATSFFRNKVPASATSSSGRTHCLRRLLQEIASLEDNLPTHPAIWLRFDEETPQYLRALITAPTQTPYSLGLFVFDVFVPDTYPQTPPKIQLLTTGSGTVRFSPNLYADGKVCLSLLNTWQGPKWNPHHSTLLQCLVSLQGLILGVEHPYYLEPGHGGWEGQISASAATASANGNGGAAAAAVPVHVQQFEDRIRMGTVRFAMLDMIKSNLANIAKKNNNSSTKPSIGGRSYLQPFSDIITAHFYHCKDHISKETLGWANSMKMSTQRRQLKQVVTQLQEELDKLEPLPAAEAAAAAHDDEEKANGGDTNNDSSGKKDDSMEQDGNDGNAKKMSATGAIESMAATKRRAMEEAAAKKEYITAGRLQSELQHLDQFGSVESKIATKRHEMEEAAAKSDYITAGQLQVAVQHLERNKKLLQDLERRMLDAAIKLDFVRAGRFQEQYKILLNSEDSMSSASSFSSKVAAQSMAASGTAGGVASAAMLGPFHPMGSAGPGVAYPMSLSAFGAAKAAGLGPAAFYMGGGGGGGAGGDDYDDDVDDYGDY